MRLSFRVCRAYSIITLIYLLILFMLPYFRPEIIQPNAQITFSNKSLFFLQETQCKFPAGQRGQQYKNRIYTFHHQGEYQLIENSTDDLIPKERISLNSSADLIAKKLGIQSEPLVVSHACISGLLAMITGMRLIQSNAYDQVVITGGRPDHHFYLFWFPVIPGHQFKSLPPF